MSVNDLVVGRVLGFPAVAMLSRAQGVMNLFHRDIMSAVRNVAFPAFARAHRNGIPVEPLFRHSVVSITAIAWPFYGFLALYPLEALRLLFGPQWDEAASLVPLFCLAGALAACWNLVLPLLTATGRIDLTTRAELLIQPIRAVILVVAVLMFGSLSAFAIAFLFIYALCIPVLFAVKQQASPTDVKALLHGLAHSLSLAAVSLALPAILKLLTAVGVLGNSGGAVMVIAATVAVISWIFGVRLTRHPLASDPLVIGAAHRVGLRAW
jgi:O-antigen/teichoic acid export membrane protein